MKSNDRFAIAPLCVNNNAGYQLERRIYLFRVQLIHVLCLICNTKRPVGVELVNLFIPWIVREHAGTTAMLPGFSGVSHV